MVQYFEIPGVAGPYFECPRYGTLSKEACRRNYRAAPDASKNGRLSGCIECEVGAGHCGVEIVHRGVSADVVCSRCRRSSAQLRTSESDGGGRMRLVRGSICVSCFNREREFLKGCNAKGTRPQKWSRLIAVSVGYVSRSRGFSVTRLPLAIDRIEAALTVMRRNDEPVSIGWLASGVKGGVACGV